MVLQMPEQPTIEDLQKQIDELRTEKEKLSTQLDSIKSENDKNSTDLKKARELNNTLLSKIPVNDNTSNEDDPNSEDSFENLVDETIEKVLKKQRGKQ